MSSYYYNTASYQTQILIETTELHVQETKRLTTEFDAKTPALYNRLLNAAKYIGLRRIWQHTDFKETYK